MKIRGLLIAALILLILGSALYWSGHRKPSTTAKVNPAAPPIILNVSEPTITELTLKEKGSPSITLVKGKSGKWQISGPESWSADQNTVQNMLGILSPLNSEQVIEAQAPDLRPFGLDQPALEVDVTETDHKTQKILFGDNTPTGETVYTMRDGEPAVFTTLAFDKNGLNKSLSDLRDKQMVTMDPDKIRDVELIGKTQDIEFHHNGESWEIVKPKPLRADYSQVDTLVRALTGATMDLSGNADKDAAADFSRAAPVATAKLTDASGTQVIQIRKSKSGYYAKSSAVEGAYKLVSDPGPTLIEGLDDFRNKNLFDFSFNDPDKIEIHNGPKAYFFTRSGEDWWSNGKKMDAESVESLVSQLRGLAATKFLDSGFTAPELQASVTSNDGKQVEKVLISQSGKNYIAKRADGPSLYQLDTSSVDALKDAAAAVKPAATPVATSKK